MQGMLVSEMTAHDLFGLMMLALLMFYLAQLGLRSGKPLNWLGHVLKYSGAFALLVFPAVYFGYGALTGG